jgi:hypothetical protein
LKWGFLAAFAEDQRGDKQDQENQKRILAMVAAVPAMTPNPSTAAIRATIKNKNA